MVDLARSFDQVLRHTTCWVLRKLGVEEWLVMFVLSMSLVRDLPVGKNQTFSVMCSVMSYRSETQPKDCDLTRGDV